MAKAKRGVAMGVTAVGLMLMAGAGAATPALPTGDAGARAVAAVDPFIGTGGEGPGHSLQTVGMVLATTGVIRQLLQIMAG